MIEIAQEVAVVPLKIANAYLVGTPKLWYLVDTGLAGEEGAIRKAAETRFGVSAKPAGIILTHGHADHAGSAQALAEGWNVKVYAPRLELPYLSGRSEYPPPDPTAPGFLATISRFFPTKAIDLGSRLQAIVEADPFPGRSGWEAIPTPGHSPGHLSFYRSADGVLLAGDAFSTINTESLIGWLTKKQQLTRPPSLSTLNWPQAKESVAKLAGLHPGMLAAGHGKPMLNINGKLQKFADGFQIPKTGRFANTAAQVGESGIVALPPPQPDYVPQIAKSVLVVGLAAGFGAVYPSIQKKLQNKKS